MCGMESNPNFIAHDLSTCHCFVLYYWYRSSVSFCPLKNLAELACGRFLFARCGEGRMFFVCQSATARVLSDSLRLPFENVIGQRLTNDAWFTDKEWKVYEVPKGTSFINGLSVFIIISVLGLRHRRKWRNGEVAQWCVVIYVRGSDKMIFRITR